MRISVRGIEPGEVDALLHFSARMYGTGSYQSRRAYYDWLYRSNPTSRGDQDCVVALSGDEIIGCVHRMRLPCTADAGTGTLASLQNHVIDPALRGGAGIMLLQKAIKGEDVAYSPGVHGRLADAYRRLGYQELPNFWLWKMVRPVHLATQLALRRFKGSDGKVTASLGKAAGFNRAGLIVTQAPDAARLERLAGNMNKQARRHPGASVPWTAELAEWRYFAAGGPRHLLVERVEEGAWSILSFGSRSGIRMARLLEYEPGEAPNFMADIAGIARAVGAALMMAYTMRVEFRDQLIAGGWRLRRDPPSSFAIGAESLSVSAAAADIGFESFNTSWS